MPEQLHWRRLTSADAELIAGLEAELFSREAWSAELVEAELTDPARHYLGVQDAAGEMIGYGGISLYPEADLMTIAVLPQWRGRGIATRLLAELLRATPAKTVFLEVRESNQAAQKLYLRAGFEVVGRRKNYYFAPREDALTMRLQRPRLEFNNQNVH